MNARYVNLFADTDGSSHFRELMSELFSTEFAPRIPPLFLSSPIESQQVSFFGAPAGWKSDWHPSSGRHLFIVMSGEWEITASDGEVRTFSSGDVILVEDTKGKGHSSRVISDDDSLALLVKL
jgi:quercetin dioxygenase-like cupin family protein